MFLRFEPKGRRLFAWLCTGHRTPGGQVRQFRYGSLGSVAYDAMTAEDRVKLWAGFPARWAAICERHPSVDPDDRAEIGRALDRRIPFPRTPAEKHALRVAKIQLAEQEALAGLAADAADILSSGLPDSVAADFLAEVEREVDVVEAETALRLAKERLRGS
jgi:hypothetical protein